MHLSNAIGRSRELLRYDRVMIDVIVEGQGPAIVLLPSLARDSDDYDEVAEGLAAAGFRVLREIDRHYDPRLGSGAWYQCGVQAVKEQSS